MGNDDDEDAIKLVSLDAKIEEIKRTLHDVMEEREKILRKLKRPPPDSDEKEDPVKRRKILKTPVLKLGKDNREASNTKMNADQDMEIQETGKTDGKEKTEEDDDKEEWTEVQNKGKRYIPPIYLYGIENWMNMARTIEAFCNSTFDATNGPEYIKVKLTSIEDYEALTKYLENEKVEFHSFQIEKTNHIKVVIKNLPPKIKEDDIKEELIRLGYDDIISVVQMRDRNKDPLPFFMATIPKSEKARDIYKITKLCYCRVYVESYKKKKQMVQCHRCQRYGHTNIQCHAQPRCVKCAGQHESAACMLSRKKQATCANCGEPHPANYRGCEYFKIVNSKQQQSQGKPKAPTNNQEELEPKAAPRIEAYQHKSKQRYDHPAPIANNTKATYAEKTSQRFRQGKTYEQPSKGNVPNNQIKIKDLICNLQKEEAQTANLFDVLKLICAQIIDNGSTK